MTTIGSEVVKTIREVLRRAFPQLRSNANPDTGASSTDEPVSGALGFMGKLFTNPGLLGFLAGGPPESAALRGSMVGLASGVEAVTEEDAGGKTTVTQRPLNAAFTVFAYIAGGIIAALILRSVRRAARIPSS
jgi:hypothetical protein